MAEHLGRFWTWPVMNPELGLNAEGEKQAKDFGALKPCIVFLPCAEGMCFTPEMRSIAWGAASICWHLQKGRVLCHRAGAPQRKQLDEWDAEYDRGKQKKVKGRGPDEWEDGGNRFQDAWNSRQHGGERHHKQVGRLSHWSCLPLPGLVCCDEHMLRDVCTALQVNQPPRKCFAYA